MNKKILIAGCGDVGKVILRIEKEAGNKCEILDPVHNGGQITKNHFIMHACFPYSHFFEESIIRYCRAYKPKYVIIHSTVKPGTTNSIQKTVSPILFYSPIRGCHDHLYEAVKNHFIKYIASSFVENNQAKKDIISHFEELNIKWEWWAGKSIGLELAKILSTTYYGWNILYAKEVKKLCDKYGVDYKNVYTQANKSYNQGYESIGRPQFIRPILYPPDGIIGGHCVTQNIELLPNCDLKFFFKELNDED